MTCMFCRVICQVVVKDIVTDCDSSLLPGRLAAVAAVSLFTDMFPKTQ